MFALTTVFISLLPLLVSPSPLNAPSSGKHERRALQHRSGVTSWNNLTFIASRPGAAYDQAPINANSRGFYIGRPTLSYVPPNIASMSNYTSPGNVTITQVFNTGTAELFSGIDGGQPVFLPPTGNLSFTLGHEEFSPTELHYTTTGFAYAPPTGSNANQSGTFVFNGLGSTGWLACLMPGGSTTAKSYQIFAEIAGFQDQYAPTGKESDCDKIEILAQIWVGDPVTWEYERRARRARKA